MKKTWDKPVLTNLDVCFTESQEWKGYSEAAAIIHHADELSHLQGDAYNARVEELKSYAGVS